MRSLIITLLLLTSYTATAIVVRHDVDDQKYHASPSDFPPLATFYVDGAHGTLIAPNWVVTAAHATFCVQNASYVKIGESLHQVENLFVHKDYTPGRSHDIALVELKNPVTDITPAQLYTKSDEAGQQIWFIGIGGTGNGQTGQTVDNFANAEVLRKAQNRVERTDGPLITFSFDHGHQALPLEGVSGGGDSGGPAFTRNEDGFYLLGISSRFEGGAIGKYGITEIYSRASHFIPWISDIQNGNADTRASLSEPRLKNLPAGLTTDILPAVCADIGLRPN